VIAAAAALNFRAAAALIGARVPSQGPPALDAAATLRMPALVIFDVSQARNSIVAFWLI